MLSLQFTSNSANIKEQLQLLQKAERTSQSLAEVLSKAGWTYDDLIYENSRTKVWKGGRPFGLADLRSASPKGIPVVSFFTGCGGMDLGLEAAGFRHLAAFEINELFCKTLRRNRPHWSVFGPPTHSGDVSRFEDISSSLARLLNSPF